MAKIDVIKLRKAVNDEYKRSDFARKCHNCDEYIPSHSFCSKRKHVVDPYSVCEFHQFEWSNKGVYR